MELEANLNLTLSKVLEEGKELEPVFGPGLTGMVNLGNTCYMNSIVQVLFSQPEIKEHYLNNAEMRLLACTGAAPESFSCQVSKLAIGLASGEYSEKKIAKKVVVEGEEIKDDDKEEYYQDGIRPGIFKALVGKGHEEFQSGRQQDAREYLSHLLEKMRLSEIKDKSGQNPSDLFNFELE